jgi:hypothetical protein
VIPITPPRPADPISDHVPGFTTPNLTAVAAKPPLPSPATGRGLLPVAPLLRNAQLSSAASCTTPSLSLVLKPKQRKEKERRNQKQRNKARVGKNGGKESRREEIRWAREETERKKRKRRSERREEDTGRRNKEGRRKVKEKKEERKKKKEKKRKTKIISLGL